MFPGDEEFLGRRFNLTFAAFCVKFYWCLSFVPLPVPIGLLMVAGMILQPIVRALKFLIQRGQWTEKQRKSQRQQVLLTMSRLI